jgi:protein O-GlcNAc transferase
VSTNLTGKLQAAFGRFQAQDITGAERLCREVLRDAPRNADALHLLGVVRMCAGNASEAVSLITRALEGNPQDAAMQENLGLAHAALGRYAMAEAAFRQALALGAAHGQVYMRLGLTLVSQRKYAEALTPLRVAAAASPIDPDVHLNLGIALAEQGQAEEALYCFRKVLALRPGHVLAHFNIGTHFLRMRQPEDAEKALRAALAVAPDDADVHSNLGKAYEDQGRAKDAEACYQKAIELDPKRPDDYFGLAELCRLQGRLDEAIASYERALALRPEFHQALAELIIQRQHICLWDGLEDMWNRLLREAIGKVDANVQPFNILSFSTSPQEQLTCATAWAAGKYASYARARAKIGFDFSSRAPRMRLRVGYLSWDYHSHPTSFLIAELFELHDRNRFEVFAYDYGPDDGSAIRERIKNATDNFVVLRDEKINEAAKRIYRDEIDILVDLKGYTFGSRTEVMALRPAPVQVNWLGFPGTMGTDCIDYIIADSFIIPEGAERFYSERVTRLPGCYQINDRKRAVSARVPTREECNLPASGIVLGCFNQPYKILPEVFAIWMRIMQVVPDSVLWLLETNRWVVENLRREASARGIAPERLVFAARIPTAEHLARYQLVDLCIDTFPYTSHTTASDALWVGCPLVTCVGDTFASRVAGSVLINAGMRELVTHSLEEYECLVVQLARNQERLSRVRRTLREARDTCPLFDTSSFVKNLERAYEEMIDARGRCPAVQDVP